MRKFGYFINVLLLVGCSKALAIEYEEYPDQNYENNGTYLTFSHLIDKEKIKTIFEIGSRDAKDAIEIGRFYKSHVYAFECNPHAIELCKQNIGQNPNVTLVPF